MAIRLVKGEWVFDTADEAAEFYRNTQANATGSRNGRPVASAVLTVPLFKAFLARLRKNQRRLVKAMLAGKDVIADAELRDALKLENNRELGGIMAGISKHAHNAGFNLEALWVSETKHSDDGERSKQFVPTENFRKVAKDAGDFK
jgi:hypothetical protein